MALPPPQLQHAQDVARAIVGQAKGLVVAGITEIELSHEIDRIAAQHGSSGMWSPTTSRVGLGTLIAHPEFPMQDRVAQGGDTCIIDVACTVDGWCGDYCETLLVGGDEQPGVAVAASGESASALSASALIAECREVAALLRAEIRPGMPASELFRFAADLLHRRNLKLLDLLDNIGHSIGEDFASDGFIDADNHLPMYGGWTIEPHVGRSARGAKFEDIIWLDRDGSVTVV
ncbi:hypothetical protein BH10ACT8_BH10ACT8_16070 [soil metagenome]